MLAQLVHWSCLLTRKQFYLISASCHTSFSCWTTVTEVIKSCHFLLPLALADWLGSFPCSAYTKRVGASPWGKPSSLASERWGGGGWSTGWMRLPFRKWIASGVLWDGSRNACQEWGHPVLAGRWIQISPNKIAWQIPPKVKTWQGPSGYAAVLGGAGTVLEVRLMRSCVSWLLHVVSIGNIIQPHWNNRRKDFIWCYRGGAIWIVYGSEIKT